VNCSGLAGVTRQNHPIDLTGLFLGLDLAVLAARQRIDGRVEVSVEFVAELAIGAKTTK
jgi:hypothetical protein